MIDRLFISPDAHIEELVENAAVKKSTFLDEDTVIAADNLDRAVQEVSRPLSQPSRTNQIAVSDPPFVCFHEGVRYDLVNRNIGSGTAATILRLQDSRIENLINTFSSSGSRRFSAVLTGKVKGYTRLEIESILATRFRFMSPNDVYNGGIFMLGDIGSRSVTTKIQNVLTRQYRYDGYLDLLGIYIVMELATRGTESWKPSRRNLIRVSRI